MEEHTLITTPRDHLVKYLEEHGETESYVLANRLNVAEAIIRYWSNALEQAEMVKVVHKSGRMFLSSTKSGAESGEPKAQPNRMNKARTGFGKFMNNVDNIDYVTSSE